MASTAEDSEGTSASADPFAMYAETLNAPRSLSALRYLVSRAVALSWQAARGRLVLNAGLQLLIAALVSAQVYFGKLVLEGMFLAAESDGSSTRRVLLPLVLLVASSSVATAAAGVMQQQQRVLGEQVHQATWRKVLDVTTGVELENYEDVRFYDQLQRVQTNSLLRPLSLAQGLVSLVGGIFGVAGLVLTLFLLEPVLVPLVLLSGVPLWFLTRRGSRSEFGFSVQQNYRLRVRAYLNEVLTRRETAKEVRAFDLSPLLRDRHRNLDDQVLAGLREQAGRQQRLLLVGTISTLIVVTLTLTILLLLVDRGRLDLAEAGAAGVAVRLLSTRVQQLFSGLGVLFESSLFLRDLEAFLALTPPVPTRLASEQPLELGRVDVRGLTFRYPGSTTPALTDVSLSIEPGQFIAVVGENGSGKSTLAKLLAGLYLPPAGTLFWSGQDVHGVDRRALRKQIAVVFQDFVRYQLTARENIAVGDVASYDDLAGIREAARRAGADELLAGLPSGYETVLSNAFQGGRDLSLGQWQRVALARAFFRDAPFIILDEPSASLDARAEDALFQRIRELLEGRTVMVISHRFSTVRSADCIYVLRDGRLVEAGRHEDLMRNDGLYRELYELQSQGYADDPA